MNTCQENQTPDYTTYTGIYHESKLIKTKDYSKLEAYN